MSRLLATIWAMLFRDRRSSERYRDPLVQERQVLTDERLAANSVLRQEVIALQERLERRASHIGGPTRARPSA